MSQRNTCLWVEVEGGTGSDIEHVAEDAIALARRIDCNISTRFNGVKLYITSRSAVAEIVEDYRRRMAESSIGAKPISGSPFGGRGDNWNVRVAEGDREVKIANMGSVFLVHIKSGQDEGFSATLTPHSARLLSEALVAALSHGDEETD